MHKGVEQVKQQLAVLDAFTAQAVATLMNLQAAGISENEIAELIKLVDMWNKLPGMGKHFRPMKWWWWQQ